MPPSTSVKPAPLTPFVKPKSPFIGLGPEEIQELGEYFRANIRDKSDLLRAACDSRRISVMDRERDPALSCELFFETGLMERLYSRCPDKTKFPEWLKDTITRQMHSYVGW